MPFYKWYGIDLAGNDKSGSLMARSPAELDAVLLHTDIACLKFQQIKPFRFSKAHTLSNPSAILQTTFNLVGFRHIS